MSDDRPRATFLLCSHCEKLYASDAAMEVHVLVAHPHSDEAEVYLAHATPLRVPRSL